MTPIHKCPDTKLHLTLKPLLSGLLWIGEIVTVRVSSLIQINLFKNIRIKLEQLKKAGGTLSGVLTNLLFYNIVVSKYKLPLRYLVHFNINTRGKKIPFFLQLWVERCHYYSLTKIDFTLDLPQKFDWALNKETKPKTTIKIWENSMIIFTKYVQEHDSQSLSRKQPYTSCNALKTK